MENINIDEKINWKAFYGRFLTNTKLSGDNLVALCPFHDDKNASFGVDIKTGMYQCMACGEKGNGTSFLAKIKGIGTKEAYKLLLEEAGIDTKPTEQKQVAKLTLEQYSIIKNLDIELLKKCGVSTGRVGLSIPYYNQDGEVVATRYRYAPGSPMRFSWSKGSHVYPYGAWLIEGFKQYGYLVLVEGESDCHTLWQHKIPAIGIPGASTFQPGWAELFAGFDLYIHHEGDRGGDTFIRKVCEGLSKSEFTGKLFKISCNLAGVKDPSELHMHDPEKFAELWDTIMQKCGSIDIVSQVVNVDSMYPGAPVALRTPQGWNPSEDGIYFFNVKTSLWQLMCKTPIQINKRLYSLDTGEEKVEIGFKRDNKWSSVIMPRSTVFQSKSITELTNVGVTVTSENAKYLVRFLGDLEAENMDVIQRSDSVSQMGWYGKNFMPCLPGNLIMDADASSRRFFDAYSDSGTLEAWTEHMSKFRDQSSIFRFVLAGAFAAPLLKLLNHRVFFIHNWGDSKGGKTAALKAALSVWGDPEHLMASFNATKVGLERMAGFFNDLPLGVDERQVAGNKQDFIETMVYMLGMGSGKLRGTKGGGLQANKQWRTVILSTGEEPLTTDSSQTGVATRVLEVYGAPFADEAEARDMYLFLENCYGVAGKAFIRELVNVDLAMLKLLFEKIQQLLMKSYDKKSGPHISSVAMVTLADMLVSKFLYGKSIELDGTHVFKPSLDMACDILKALDNSKDSDVVEKARDFILSWCRSNHSSFTRGGIVSYGEYDNVTDVYYIFPSVLNKALSDEGFSYRKVQVSFAERGYVTVSADNKNSILKWIDNHPCRVVAFQAKYVEQDSLMEKSALPF